MVEPPGSVFTVPLSVTVVVPVEPAVPVVTDGADVALEVALDWTVAPTPPEPPDVLVDDPLDDPADDDAGHPSAWSAVRADCASRELGGGQLILVRCQLLLCRHQ